MSEAPVRVLLGPQNPVRNIGAAVSEAGIPEGPLAVISAAWQEAEGDLDELQGIVGRPLEDLELYRRAEELLHEVPALASAYRRRQDRLQEQQRLYRVRLRSLAVATRRMFRADLEDDLAAAEQRHAIAQLRALDRHHLNRTEALHGEFEDQCRAAGFDAFARHREGIDAILARTAGVIVTGGNIAILINRLRLFAIGEALRATPVVAWSAGAMVLAERIVLFHDRMPQGRRDPEVFGAGLGLLPGYVVLPDARHRIRAADRMRIGLMARRFSPDVCVGLDNDTAIRLTGNRLIHVDGARRLDRNGRFGRLRQA
jgi:hypothetical protein